jgi:hypothetical protein
MLDFIDGPYEARLVMLDKGTQARTCLAKSRYVWWTVGDAWDDLEEQLRW